MKLRFDTFWVIILVLVLIPIVVFGSSFVWPNIKASYTESVTKSSSSSQPTAKSSSLPSSIIQPKNIQPNLLNLNTLFVGDVFWGRYVDDWSKASNLKFAYPFSGLNTFDKTKYNAWIGGLECPITSTYLDSRTQDNLLKFSCPVEYTQEAAKWFDAFTLANNHTDNMQEVDGFVQTKQNLEANKIQYFGHFDNSNIQDICEVLSFEATPTFLETRPTVEQKYFVPIALCGFHNVFRLPTEAELAVISEYSKYFITITMPHQGKEYTFKADSLQSQYAKKMIDLGADAVIGNHVHSTQNTEVYKNKLIVYSLGNFIFDQQRTAQVTQAIGANLDIQFEVDDNMQKWLKLSQSCQKFKDNCLQEAKTQMLNKPKFEIKYNLVCSDNSNKLAKKASDKVCENLYKIANWPLTKSKLE